MSTGRAATDVPLSRRVLLRGGLAAGLVIAVGGAEQAIRPRTAVAAAGPGDPFTLGVASGDPAPDGMVLWTRLAPDPLAPDGLGGLGGRRTDVEWELATDERFRGVVRRGVAPTGPELGHSVHVEPVGLAPGREYFYRFRAGGELSPVGRTRTAPRPSAPDPLTMCFASCAHYEHGFFGAYARLAEEEPDLVLHLGDYLYEGAGGVGSVAGGFVREHAGPETVTLADYRRRHAQYRTDADLQAAHAVAPWLVVWDDHEVENNWAGEMRDTPALPPGPFLPRRAAAFRAYWENMPLRAAQRPRGSAMQLYRRIGWGATATFHMLDTRQYRDHQICDGQVGCTVREDAIRSMPGSTQERWLADGLRRSRARWDVLGQQVFFSQLDLTPGPGRSFGGDTWDGYPASRDRVVDSWIAAGVRNAVVLTGDVHSHWAADIRRRFDDPASPVVGTELVTSSISTGGDGSAVSAPAPTLLAENPHLHFHSNRRGYVRTRITATELTADFRVLPTVQRRGAPAETHARFVVDDGRSGLNAV